MAALSSGTRRSPHPLTSQCMRAPPISSSETFSPMTSSAIRGEPRYIDAFRSCMNTTSQNAGMYAPPAADGPSRQHTWGMRPLAWHGRDQQALLREGAIVVQQQPQAFPDEQLSLLGQLLVVLLGATGPGPFQGLRDGLAAARLGHGDSVASVTRRTCSSGPAAA